VTEQARRDVKMVGETSSAGGYFRKVRLTGESTFSGDVDCIKLTQIGELEIAGGLTVGEMKMTGECQVRGRLNGGKVSGRGELEVMADLRGEAVKFTGNIVTGGDCGAGMFKMDGAFSVAGLLSADTLDVRMYGPCVAKEIGGSKIFVRRSRAKKLLSLVNGGGDCKLNAEQIEGDVVALEHTEADVVRGNRVEIGPGCRIGRVEYRSEVDIHKSADVQEVVQV